MKKLFFTLVLVVMAFSLLAGCTQPAPTTTPLPTEAPMTEVPVVTEAPTELPVAAPIVVTDALDRTVEFEQLPTRIVIAGKAAFMLLDAAFLFPEAPQRIVGYELRSQTGLDFINIAFPSSSQMQILDQDAGPEQIAPLNPDLVMMKSYLADGLGSQVEQLGVKVIYLDLETPEAINKDIRTLGAIFGNAEKAEQLLVLYEHAAKEITDVTDELLVGEKPSTLMLQYSDKGGEIAFKVPPVDWLQTGLVVMAGGNPVWMDAPTDGWTTITLEQVAAWNPDVIILIDYKGNALEVTNSLITDEKWMLLDAVKNEKLFAFPLDFQSWDQPDTRWPLGLAWLATKLHPDLFGSVSMVTEIQTFYRDYYGLNDTQIQDLIMPLVKGDL